MYFPGVLQIRPPRRAKVFLKLCGLKYGSPAAVNASLNICLIGLALLQCLRSSPAAANRILSPTTTLVAEIEAWAKALGVTRSEALRHLVEIGLKNR